MTDEPISVLLVDDHQIVRRGLRAVLEEGGGSTSLERRARCVMQCPKRSASDRT